MTDASVEICVLLRLPLLLHVQAHAAVALPSGPCHVYNTANAMITFGDCAKLHILLLCLSAAVSLPVVNGASSWRDGDGHEGAAQFSRSKGDLLQRGKDQVEALYQKSNDEGVVDIMFGTNCYTSAVRSLEQGCQAMDTDTSMWLAFHLANCLWAKTGRRTYSGGPCTQQGQDAAPCISQMSNEDYIVFIQFLQNVHTMCMFVANADFQERAEAMLNTLFRAGSEANLQVTHLNKGLRHQTLTLEAMDGELHSLARDQQHIADGLKTSIDMLGGLRSAAAALTEGMHRSEAAHQQLLHVEEAVAIKLAHVRQEQMQHVEASQAVWKAAEHQARQVLEWQEKYIALQEAILINTEAMTQASDGMKLALSFVEAAQERGNNALATVLGKSYGLTDFAFYGCVLITTMAVGWSSHFRRAQLHVFMLLLACIGLERMMLAWLAPWFKVGPIDQPVLNLPPPLDWLIGAVSVEWIKSYLRAATLICIVMVLARSAILHQHPETVLARLLQYLMELESRQARLWHNMEARLLGALHRVRHSGSSSHGCQEGHDVTAQVHAREQRMLNQMRLEAVGAQHSLPRGCGRHHSQSRFHGNLQSFESVPHYLAATSPGPRRGRVTQQGIIQQGILGTDDVSTAVACADSKYQDPQLEPASQSPQQQSRLPQTATHRPRDTAVNHPAVGHHSYPQLRRSSRLSGSQIQTHESSMGQSGKKWKGMSTERVSQESGAVHATSQPQMQGVSVGTKRNARVLRETAAKRNKPDR
eukprot:jgi/Ulvmu1/12908/UM098_0096.1